MFIYFFIHGFIVLCTCPRCKILSCNKKLNDLRKKIKKVLQMFEKMQVVDF